jgi:hypothetical protein
MTELLAPFGAPTEAVDATPPTPAFITEQQVLFATAAAVSLQPAKTRRSWTQAVHAFVTAAFVRTTNEARPKRPQHPARNDFLEDSRMAREMLRL